MARLALPALLLAAACGGAATRADVPRPAPPPPSPAPGPAAAGPAATTCDEAAHVIAVVGQGPRLAGLVSERRAAWTARFEAAAAAACHEQAWWTAVRDCFGRADEPAALHVCYRQLGETSAWLLDGRIEAVGLELWKAEELPLQAAAEAPERLALARGLDDATGVAACDAYVAALRDFVLCEGIPLAAVNAHVETDAAGARVPALRPAWAGLHPRSTAADRAEAAARCDQGTAVLRQVIDALRCTAAR
jgi:hypothetical protein